MFTESTKAEQIARSYTSAFDSVNLINTLEKITNPTPDELAIIVRNKEHLRTILSRKEWFTTEDLTALMAAS